MTTDQYCREVESHLCRQNDGHLIRIVGPSFELVCGWAERGIPLNVVLHGIDRHFQRYYAKGPRRRPVHIDFCEADVLDAFDDWRRAVGIFLARSTNGQIETGPASPKSRQSLATHVDRVAGRLVARRTNPETPQLNGAVADAIERLASLRDIAPKARGAIRAQIVEQLAELDRSLMAAACACVRSELRASLEQEATADLEPFRERMAADVYRQAVRSATERLIRDRLSLPTIAYQ